jgi:hypothetical protein
MLEKSGHGGGRCCSSIEKGSQMREEGKKARKVWENQQKVYRSVG